MSYCEDCGTQLNANSLFCGNCGKKTGSGSNGEPVYQATQQTMDGPASTMSFQTAPNQQQQAPNYQQPNHRYQQGYQPGSQPPMYHQSDYIRPADYQFTTSMTQRIMGTLRRDIDVVEEIEEREDLNAEATRLLLINFSIIALFNIMGIFAFPQYYLVINPIGSIVEIVALQFIGGFLFIQMIASVGKSFGGQKTDTSNEEMRRVLAYAYTALVVEGILYFLSDMYFDSGLLLIAWLVSLLYAFFVFLFAVRRALDTGFGTAFISIVVAYIGRLIVNFIILYVIFSIFGDTYYFW
ncbi:MAG: hypothetical protein ACXAE3_01010 [Candidatus Kariarchaeaceae archaeon]|jgi:hypothetical protein